MVYITQEQADKLYLEVCFALINIHDESAIGEMTSLLEGVCGKCISNHMNNINK